MNGETPRKQRVAQAVVCATSVVGATGLEPVTPSVHDPAGQRDHELERRRHGFESRMGLRGRPEYMESA
jgi:hypothetical protein